MFFVILTLILVAQCMHSYRLSARRGRRSVELFPDQRAHTRLYGRVDEPVWSSAVSTNADLNEAIVEVINKSKAYDDYNECIAIVFVSSIYEYAAFNLSSIHDQIKTNMKNIKYVFGCTTGAVVGVDDMRTLSPVEIESRASITLILAHLSNDISSSVFRLDPGDVDVLLNDNTPTMTDNISNLYSNRETKSNDAHGSVTLLLATESVKSNLSEIVSKIKSKLNTDVFGAVASSVTSLHMPKLFLSSMDRGDFEKYNNGIIGITLKGNISTQSVIARSCLPVGPVFAIEEVNGREIIGLRNLDDDTIAPPLVQLEQVIETISSEQSYLLKRELLVGITPTITYLLTSSLTSSLKKPVSFEPLVGSITIPCLVKPGHLFQFCVRDATATRQDLSLAMSKVSNIVQNCKDNDAHIMSVLLLGSMERGNKVFRHQNWESVQLYHKIQSVLGGKEGGLPPSIGGFYSAGTILHINDPADTDAGGNVAIMEADSTYTFITKIYNNKNNHHSSAATALLDSTVEDIMSKEEVAIFSDINDGVIVSKRDPESAHPTRVASMDYYVPDKIPQPRNILESMLWDREKDVDRMRERFQMSKALIQAKLSEAKYPQRDLVQTIIDANIKRSLLSKDGAGIPPIMVEIVRNSLHNGKREENGLDIVELAKKYESCGIVALGANADFGTFRGQYEDVDAIKLSTKVPIFCNDFVAYGYQIFKAKSSGADVIKLMAAILSPADINYLIKVAKALRIACMVVVSSKLQLLEVLTHVQGMQMISVSSRNMRIWKLQPMKATNILQDEEVKASIKAYKEKAANEGGKLLIFQEGFSSIDELNQSTRNGVDAVILGEELLKENSTNVVDTFTKWII